MLVWLAEFAGSFPILNVFRYITFRAGGATATALLFVFFFGPAAISWLQDQAGQGPADPHRRAGIASRQARHADHGRPDDPDRTVRRDAALGQPAQPVRLDRARRHRDLWRDRFL
jgi:hypothetical protein